MPHPLEYIPFQKKFSVEESKQEVTKVASLVNIGETNKCIQSPNTWR